MRLLAIDPGTTKSGWVVIDGTGKPLKSGWAENAELLGRIGTESLTEIAIEDITSYGMPVGKDVFETVRWTGRFDHAASLTQLPATYIGRKEVMLELCGSVRGKDSTLRQAAIDRFGGDEIAVGGKKCQTCKGKGWLGRDHVVCGDCHCAVIAKGCGFVTHPGVLHGFKGSHMFSALGVALTYIARL